MSLRVHDISVPVRAGMLISGRQPEFTRLYAIAEGAEYNVSAWRLHAHTGTHVETGLHYVDGRGRSTRWRSSGWSARRGCST